MNRAARREDEKKKKHSNKNVMRFLKNLTKEQREIIHQKSEEIADEQFKKLILDFDTGFTAAMFEMTELNKDEIKEIFISGMIMTKDHAQKEQILQKSSLNKEGYVNMVKDLEKAVFEEAVELFKNKVLQKEVVNKLTVKYSSLSIARVKIKIKEAKISLKEVEASEIQKAAEKIMDIIEPKNISYEKTNITAPEVKKNEKVSDVPKKEKEPVEAKINVIESKKGPLEGIRVKKIEATGRFAHYTAESKKIKFKLNRSFDRNTWEALKNEVEAMFTMMEMEGK